MYIGVLVSFVTFVQSFFFLSRINLNRCKSIGLSSWQSYCIYSELIGLQNIVSHFCFDLEIGNRFEELARSDSLKVFLGDNLVELLF